MNYPKNLRALSVAGAYAWLIAIGEKPEEFRTWPITGYRGMVLLHNSTTTEWDDSWDEIIQDGDVTREQAKAMKGKLIGFAFLTDCISAQPDGYDGYFHCMDALALFLEPVPAPGARNYWKAQRPEQQRAFSQAWKQIMSGRYEAANPELTDELLVRYEYKRPRIFISGPSGQTTTNTGT